MAYQMGIYDMLTNMSDEICKIQYVEDVDFDIDYYNELNQLVILVEYNYSVWEYANGDPRDYIILEVMNIASKFGFKYSGDNIEDMGNWLYFVFNYSGPAFAVEEK
jgi:hypothetical protein